MGDLSILFETPADRIGVEASAMHDAFHDLHLDEIIAAITAGRTQYDLDGFFARPLRRVGAIAYRQEAMRDFENPGLFENLARFAAEMRSVRSHLALSDKLYYRHQKDAWRLDAAAIYCDAVTALSADLATAELNSRASRTSRRSD